MAASSRPTPRFRKRAPRSELSPWYLASMYRRRLVCADADGEFNPNLAWDRSISEHQIEYHGLCPGCKSLSTEAKQRAHDVVVFDHTAIEQRFTAKTIDREWISGALGSPIHVLNDPFYEAIAPDLDGSWHFGSVLRQTGETVPGIRTLLDPNRIKLRCSYSPTWFKYFPRGFYACPHCGRFLPGALGGTWYALASQIRDGYIRECETGLLVPQRTVERLELNSRRKWPRLELVKIPVFDDLRDPFPDPLPILWDEFVEWERSFGNEVPAPFFHGEPQEKRGPWVEAYSKSVGVPIESLDWEPDDATSWLQSLRLRALWEPKIAERLDGIDDNALRRLVASGMKHHPDDPVESWIGIESTARKRKTR